MNWDDDKNEIADRLLDLHLGEVDEAEREELEAALAASPQLAARLEVEGRLHDALKSRLRREQAPPGLETRIRASLDADDGVASPATVVAAAAKEAAEVVWYRRPIVGALAAAAMLAAFLFANADEIRSMWRGADPTAPVQSATVMVVDQACDEQGVSIARQKLCTAPSHLNALRLSDGRYWQIATSLPAHRAIVTDAQLRGHHLTVVGRLYEPIGTFEIQTMQDLGETLESAALHRH